MTMTHNGVTLRDARAQWWAVVWLYIALGIYCTIENHRVCSSGGWQLLPRFMMTIEQRAELRRGNK